MKTPCSNCNQRLEIPEELAGQTIECPSCNASLAVPLLASPPSATPQARVTTPQAAKPQKPAPQRKTAAQPKAASSKKSKSSIPKWAIASVAGIAVMIAILIMFFPDDSNGILPSEPMVVKTYGESQQLSTEAKAPDISLLKAAKDGNIEDVKLLIANGADVNARNKDGETPLHHAASFGHKEIIELLIAKGADVNAKDNSTWEWTPIAVASSLEIIKLFRKHGGKYAEELK